MVGLKSGDGKTGNEDEWRMLTDSQGRDPPPASLTPPRRGSGRLIGLQSLTLDPLLGGEAG